MAAFAGYVFDLVVGAVTGPAPPRASIVTVGVGITASFCLVSYFGATSAIRFLAGAHRVSIGDEGIRIEYPSGREDILRWTDRDFNLTLLDFSEQPDWVKANWAYRLERTPRLPVLGPYHRRSLITKEIFDAILSTAKSSHMSIRIDRAGPLSDPGQPLRYRIQRGL